MESKNRIIAKFDGWQDNPKYNGIVKGLHGDHAAATADSWEDLHYDEDWNMLMPVVERVEAISGAYIDIHKEATKVKFQPGEVVEWSYTAWDQENKIAHVYAAVIEFITWFNKQNDEKRD